ncbi:MAG: rhodanese-like domain-containing protein [Sulfurovum sp.]|nr:rhodanese-like domain-containing protein [Sulfurovum sp.]
MKKIILILLLTYTSLMAELTHVWASQDFANKNIKIIDIRTPAEWKETGIVKGSYTIMFYDEKGDFSVKDFIKDLDKVVKKDEPFALICRVGSRTAIVSKYLSAQRGYKVINLKGGIMKMIGEGYKTVPYKEKK